MSVLEVKYGLGRHIVYITPTLTEFLKSVTVGELTNALGVGFVKLSVCFFVLRLIDRTHRRVTRTLYSVMLLNTAVTLVAVFCIAFQCRPFEKIWHRNIPGHCFSSQILTNITRTVGGELLCLNPALAMMNDNLDSSWLPHGLHMRFDPCPCFRQPSNGQTYKDSSDWCILVWTLVSWICSYHVAIEFKLTRAQYRSVFDRQGCNFGICVQRLHLYCSSTCSQAEPFFF